MEKDKIRKPWENICILGTTKVRKAKSTAGVAPDQVDIPSEPELRMHHS